MLEFHTSIKKGEYMEQEVVLGHTAMKKRAAISDVIFNHEPLCKAFLLGNKDDIAEKAEDLAGLLNNMFGNNDMTAEKVYKEFFNRV